MGSEQTQGESRRGSEGVTRDARSHGGATPAPPGLTERIFASWPSYVVALVGVCFLALCAWGVYVFQTLPPLHCNPHAHPAIELPCKNGRVTP